MRRQRTLSRTAEFAGVGVHSGSSCVVHVEPAEADSGVKFLVDGVYIPAEVEFVVRCDRSTVLGFEGREVSTVEHLLSSVAALSLTNLTIRVEGPEIPILDGSALPFFEGLFAAGVVEQALPCRILELSAPVWVGGGDTCMIALPYHEPLLDCALHYDHPMLGYQQCTFAPWRDSFSCELAPAVTFALWEEVQVLLDRGLARGGSLDNALVAHIDHWSRPLRLENEPVRHKCLDLLGDLSLLGAPLRARILAVRAGHRWHVELVRKLRKETVNVNG